jgi:hypothetical protein
MDVPPRVLEMLAPAERVLWTGQPRQGIRIYAVDLLRVPIIVFVAAAVAWISKEIAMNSGTGAFRWIAGAIGAVLAGVMVRSAWRPFLRDRDRRRQITYVLTDRHAFIAMSGGHRAVDRIVLRDLKHVSYVLKRDGSGTIAFGRWWPDPPSSYRDFALRPPLWWRAGVAFEQIPDAQRVYEHVQAARATAPE